MILVLEEDQDKIEVLVSNPIFSTNYLSSSSDNVKFLCKVKPLGVDICNFPK
jgi:hypothetical protein